MKDKNIEMNSEYIKVMRNRYDYIIARGEWEKISALEREMEEDGYGEFVPLMSQMMSDDDVRLYKKWDKEVNGDTDVQMDDWS